MRDTLEYTENRSHAEIIAQAKKMFVPTAKNFSVCKVRGDYGTYFYILVFEINGIYKTIPTHYI